MAPITDLDSEQNRNDDEKLSARQERLLSSTSVPIGANSVRTSGQAINRMF